MRSNSQILLDIDSFASPSNHSQCSLQEVCPINCLVKASIIIQLADHLDRAGYAWEKIQAEQLRAEMEIPNVNTVICRDVCDNIDIHPKEKDTLSKRIVNVLK